MKDKPGTMLSVAAAGLLLLGDLGLFFAQIRIAGYVLFAIGCVLGIAGIIRGLDSDTDEKFHFIVVLTGLLMLGVFIFTGAILAVVILALVLFAIDFLLALLDLRTIYEHEDSDDYFDEYAQPSVKEPIKEIKVGRDVKPERKEFAEQERKFEKERKFEELQKRKVYEDLDIIKDQLDNIEIMEDGFTDDKSIRKQAEQIKKEIKGATFADSKRNNEKKLGESQKKRIFDDLDNIKEQLDSIKILEDGRTDDKNLRRQAEQIKKELRGAVFVEDPKAGRYFYKEEGKTFHVAGCVALQKINKKELKSSQSRTVLLARGYRPCKVCGA